MRLESIAALKLLSDERWVRGNYDSVRESAALIRARASSRRTTRGRSCAASRTRHLSPSVVLLLARLLDERVCHLCRRYHERPIEWLRDGRSIIERSRVVDLAIRDAREQALARLYPDVASIDDDERRRRRRRRRRQRRRQKRLRRQGYDDDDDDDDDDSGERIACSYECLRERLGGARPRCRVCRESLDGPTLRTAEWVQRLVSIKVKRANSLPTRVADWLDECPLEVRRATSLDNPFKGFVTFKNDDGCGNALEHYICRNQCPLCERRIRQPLRCYVRCVRDDCPRTRYCWRVHGQDFACRDCIKRSIEGCGTRELIDAAIMGVVGPSPPPPPPRR